MGYRDAMIHGETNVGLGMVDDSEEDRLIEENRDLRARLAAIERQVLWRTKDMPSDAKTWIKDRGETPVYLCTEGLRLVKAPDHRPEMTEGELPIFDAPEGS